MRCVVKVFSIVCIGFLSACVSSDNFANKQNDEVADLKIKLERSVCYGFCPSYIVEISGDGNVSYCGMAFVEQTGLRTRQINPNKVRSLYDQILAANFFSLQDSYTALITDNPTYIVSVSVDGRTKTVADYVGHKVGMPESVTGIQKSIDDLAGVSDWVGEINYDYKGHSDLQTQKCKRSFE